LTVLIMETRLDGEMHREKTIADATRAAQPLRPSARRSLSHLLSTRARRGGLPKARLAPTPFAVAERHQSDEDQRRDWDERVSEPFTEKLADATADQSFQISTDGFTPYRDAIVLSLGAKKVDFAQVIKVFGTPQDEDHRYSPPEVIELQKIAVFGNPDLDKATTSHVERHNLSTRMQSRRYTRLTNAFSKKWEKHHAALALWFAYYNFCRVHRTLRVTPAMEAKITDHVWTLKELMTA
jgi:hypothetical protein